MGIPLPLHYRQGSNRGDGRYMLGHTGHKHCRGTYASPHACKHVRGTHCKHGQSMDKCRQGTQGGHTPLTGTNRHVRGLGASVVKRRQGRVTNGYPTRPHFAPQATTPHPNTHGFLNHPKHLHPSAPLPGKRRAPLNSLYYQGGVPTHLTSRAIYRTRVCNEAHPTPPYDPELYTCATICVNIHTKSPHHKPA